jgi:hypothetical protein
MIKRIVVIAALVTTAALVARVQAFDETHHGHNARWRASLRPWHGRYYSVQYGQPVALVVPPTAELQTDYGWGVCSSRMTRIDHQFQRPWPDGFWSPFGYGFFAAPQWPSDTRQFGVYYVRGPW